MRILMLSWEYPPQVVGGLGRHVAELAPALAQEGIEVHVLAPANGPTHTQHISPNLIVHRIDAACTSETTDFYRRVYQINECLDAFATRLWPDVGGFDLIHAHDWLVGFAAIELKLAHKCPLVATMHATERGRWRSHFLPNDLSRKIDRVEQSLTFEAWRVIACSQYMVDELGRLFSLPLGKLDTIPNGINLDVAASFSEAQLAAFRAAYVKSEQMLVFSVGRLVYEKGFHILVQSMSQILQNYPSARLVVAGKGPLLDHLRNLAADLGISENVIIPGFITDAERDMFLSVADCAVFPSLYEPFGIVALEAMAFGCPVVASNVGGLAEVVSHNQIGTLIYPDNPESAAWGVLRVLNQPDTVQAYAANARRMVVEKYSWQKIARQTVQVYQRVVDERAKTRW